MATYTLQFYNADPFFIFSRTAGGTATYTGPADAEGTAVITDNGTGNAGAVLDDDNATETATADVTLGGNSSAGSSVDAEEGWTLRDTVTGETFQVVTFEVEDGAATGYYLLSEIPLVAGRTYETLTFDNNPNANISGDPVFSYADFDFPTLDGIVEGTSGDDVIDADYTGDPDGDVVDGFDNPSSDPFTPLQFNWTDYSDETNLSGGISQDTGGIQVDVAYTGPSGGEFSAEHTSTQYVASGETYPANSSAYLYQNGNATDAQVTFDFSSVSGSGFEDEVQNVSFRINDIDGVIDGFNNFQDIVTITAYDADGNEVPVTITLSGDDSLSDQTITAAITNNSESQAAGSVLVEIAGPVARIVIDYDNGGNTQQAIYFTDLHFDAVPLGTNDDLIQAGDGNDIVDAGLGDDEVYGEAGNDTLSGGEGADILDGGTGDDRINIGDGDTASGGDGDDTFVIDASLLAGGTISVDGGEGAETAGDTLDFAGQLVQGSIVYSNEDDSAGGLSGTATLLDGTTLTFTGIETIICFASGTLIDTPHGPRPIESLAPGDLVLTADDGPRPIRWHGYRTVSGVGAGAPVRFAPGAIGNAGPLIVSPQHRMLVRDPRTQLYFGEEEVLVPAKALVDGRFITEAPCAEVTWHHIMLDRHAILTAEGAPAESYHPGAYSLDGLDPAQREALFAAFPTLRADPNRYGPAARKALRAGPARILAAA